ncbi:MAG: DUF2127 domain-containing protein [Candidatus Binatia bacterium]
MPATSSFRLLRLIGLFKLVKAVVLLASLATIFRLLRHNPTQRLIWWALKLHVDPDNQYLQAALSKLLALDGRQSELLAAATVFYAMLFAIEGVGLLFDMAWAEYLTIVETAGFIPIEIYEIVRNASAVRVMTLAVNVTIVAYLGIRLRRRKRSAC